MIALALALAGTSPPAVVWVNPHAICIVVDTRQRRTIARVPVQLGREDHVLCVSKVDQPAARIRVGSHTRTLSGKVVSFDVDQTSGSALEPRRGGIEAYRRVRADIRPLAAGPLFQSGYGANGSGPQIAAYRFDSAYANLTAWSAAWSSDDYDRNHVVVGTVSNYDGADVLSLAQTGWGRHVVHVNGATIVPAGNAIRIGDRVATFGYWSGESFLANRVIIRGAAQPASPSPPSPNPPSSSPTPRPVQ